MGLFFPFPESCVSCNSNNDVNCAQYPQKLMAKSCSTSNSKCYTRIIGMMMIKVKNFLLNFDGI